MSTQLAPERIGSPVSTPLNVSDMSYAFDINSNNGVFNGTLKVIGIVDTSVFSKTMASVGICPVTTGALVSSVTGGTIVGHDMYGQYLEETVAAAATTKRAFAAVVSAPADAVWEDKFGLPYRLLFGTGGDFVTLTPPEPTTANGDHRGTFVVDDPLTAGEEREVLVNYTANQKLLFGPPYASLFATPDRIAEATLTGTINSSGEIAVTIFSSIADGSATLTLTTPDGVSTEVANTMSTFNYTLNPIWLSMYRNSALPLDELVRGVTLNGTPIKVLLTGSIN